MNMTVNNQIDGDEQQYLEHEVSKGRRKPVFQHKKAKLLTSIAEESKEDGELINETMSKAYYARFSDASASTLNSDLNITVHIIQGENALPMGMTLRNGINTILQTCRNMAWCCWTDLP